MNRRFNIAIRSFGAVVASLAVITSASAAADPVSTIGALNGGTSSASGASISGSTLYLQSASSAVAGLIDTNSQTFSGSKTFSGQINASGGLYVSGYSNLRDVYVSGSIYQNSYTGPADTINVTNTYQGANTPIIPAIELRLSSGVNPTGQNTTSGINFVNVTPTTNNAFIGLNFGTGYNSLLSYNGTSVINGNGVVQPGSLSGTYTNSLTLSSASNIYVGQSVNLSGNAKIGSLTNVGSTVNGALVLGDHASNGPVGTASATVDSFTYITVNQTTASKALTLPKPSDQTAGRSVYISNIGSMAFKINGTNLAPGDSIAYIWNGVSWSHIR